MSFPKAVVVGGLGLALLTGCSSDHAYLNEAEIRANDTMVFEDMAGWPVTGYAGSCDVKTEDLVVDSRGVMWVDLHAKVCREDGENLVYRGPFGGVYVELRRDEVDKIDRVDNADVDAHENVNGIEVYDEIDWRN